MQVICYHDILFLEISTINVPTMFCVLGWIIKRFILKYVTLKYVQRSNRWLSKFDTFNLMWETTGMNEVDFVRITFSCLFSNQRRVNDYFIQFGNIYIDVPLPIITRYIARYIKDRQPDRQPFPCLFTWHNYCAISYNEARKMDLSRTLFK